MKTTRVLSLLLVAVTSLAEPPVRAEEPPRLTARDLVGIKVPKGPDVAPDGARVAFSLAEPDFDRSRVNHDVYVARLDAPGTPRRMTYTPDSDETAPRFSPDGRMLAFVSDRPVPDPDAEEPEGDEDPKKQVWVMPVDGGEARPLTSAEEGVFEFRWAPDGRSIVFTAREVLPKPESERKAGEKKRKIDATVVDKERHRREFWIARLDDGDPRRLSRGDFGVGAFDVSPDGREVVYETNLTGREDDEKKFDLYVLSVASGQSRQLTTRPGPDKGPRWSPDGRTVAFTGHSDGRYEYSRVDLFVVPAAGGKVRSVSAPLDRSVASIAWSSDSRRVVAAVVDGVHQPVYRFDTADVSPEKPARLTAQPLVALEVAVSRDGRRVAAIVETATAAPELWSVAEAGAAAVTDFNAELRSRAVARQEAIRWKASDGTEIEGVLTYPVGYEAGTRVPLVVEVHGGPFDAAKLTLRGYYFHPQLLAAEGYAVLAPNFRGSDGYGDAFGQASRGDLGGKDYLDIQAGVDHVVSMGVADANRLGIVGLSYGGYMTNWTISQTDRFKGAISESGIFSFVTDFSNTNIPSWEPDYLGGYYWERPELYRERSPARFVDRIRTPVLIVHGEEDMNTFISNSKEMYQALRALGRTTELVVYPREEHGFEEPNHRVDEATRWVAWLDKHVRAEPAALYAVGDFVPAGAWEYSVASVDADATYTGTSASGRFVEVTVLFRGEPRKSAPVDLRPRDVAMVLADGRELAPVGIVIAAAGARAIVRGDATIRAEVGEDDARGYVPVVLAFDVPKGVTGARVRYGAFAPVAVSLPADGT